MGEHQLDNSAERGAIGTHRDVQAVLGLPISAQNRERLEEETLAEKVERVVDIADRSRADPRDVSPAEVTEAKALLTSMRHYEHALAPIRRLRIDWREPRQPVSEIPPAPRSRE